jgi:hypothetical protein
MFDISNYLSKKLNYNDILFVLHNENISTDSDYYVVTNQNVTFFHTFQEDNGCWIEVFVDSLSVHNRKIESNDEIIINFMLQFTLHSGNEEAFWKLKEAAQTAFETFDISELRKSKLSYRIKVLDTKFKGIFDMNDKMILHALVYPITQLLLYKSIIVPDSPKYWYSQIHNALPLNMKLLYDKLLNYTISKQELEKLITYTIDNYSGLYILYSEDTSSTFVV